MIDINGATIGITRDDGTETNIDIEPVNVEIEGILSSTGVYELFDEDHKSLGQVAFSLEDAYEWVYESGSLSDNEIDQIVRFIQNDKETLHTFTFKQHVDDIEHDYLVMEDEGHFYIEKDGEYLAEIQNNEQWEQITGDPLDPDLFVTIVNMIKERYE